MIRADVLQHHVTRGAAPGVVDRLEVVDVQNEQGAGPVGVGGGRQHTMECYRKMAVGEGWGPPLGVAGRRVIL